MSVIGSFPSDTECRAASCREELFLNNLRHFMPPCQAFTRDVTMQVARLRRAFPHAFPFSLRICEVATREKRTYHRYCFHVKSPYIESVFYGSPAWLGTGTKRNRKTAIRSIGRSQ